MARVTLSVDNGPHPGLRPRILDEPSIPGNDSRVERLLEGLIGR
jgi:hypothetical protein